MIEGLIIVLILAFLTLIIAVAKAWYFIIIPQAIIAGLVVFLLIRVRVKISKAEKEKLRAKIEELERKIESLGKKVS